MAEPSKAARLPAEIYYADELAALPPPTPYPRPPGWSLSPGRGGLCAGRCRTGQLAQFVAPSAIVTRVIISWPPAGRCWWASRARRNPGCRS